MVRSMLRVLVVLVVSGSVGWSFSGQASAQAEGLCDVGQVEQFIDVNPGDYAAAYVHCMRALGLSVGRGAGDYGPDLELTRAEMATFLARLWRDTLGNECPGEPASPFTDTAGSLHEANIDCIYALGVTRGTSATTFGPSAPLIASHLSLFLTRVWEKAGNRCAESDASVNQSRAARCLADLRVVPTVSEAGSSTTVTRAQKAVYMIGLWHNLTGRGLPPEPPRRPTTTTGTTTTTQPGGGATTPPPATGSVTVRLESSAPRVVTGPFDITINFSEPVIGLTISDLQVSNGRVDSLSGHDAYYTVGVIPAADGTVAVWLPADTVEGQGARGNSSSLPITRTMGSRTGAGLDTWNRAGVLQAFRTEFQRYLPDPDFTGDVDECIAGATSQAYRDSIFQRINWYRRMAGLGTVAENPEYSAEAQQAALMMAAQYDLSHYPGPDWACYTATGAGAAGRSNLSLGRTGTFHIDGYMEDPGDRNTEVGHRRWILYPQTMEMGTGDASWANALTAWDGYVWASRPAVRETRGFVAWPPPGYVPAYTVWPRWSFSLPDADFSTATVVIRDDAGPIQTTVVARPASHGAPEPSIVWETRPAFSEDDHCYMIIVTGVILNGSVATPYEYAVCVIGNPWSPE